MQIVTEVSELYPPEDSEPIPRQRIPSMLHHIDKTDLEKFTLEHIFENYDDFDTYRGNQIEDEEIKVDDASPSRP